MSTGFARDYIMTPRCAPRTARSPDLRVDVIADHGAFDSTAQPTSSRPASFTSCAAPTTSRPRTSRSRRSTRTRRRAAWPTALVPDHRGRVSGRADGRRTRPWRWAWTGRAADEQLHRPDQFPYETTTGGRTTRATTPRPCARRCASPATRTASEQAEKRARGELMGDRRVVLHRGRRRRPAQAHGHPRAGDERRRRPAACIPSARRWSASPPRPRARATRRRSPRSWPRSSASRPRTSRSATATPTVRRTGSGPRPQVDPV